MAALRPLLPFCCWPFFCSARGSSAERCEPMAAPISAELERIHEGLQQWRGRGIAGTIDSEFRRQVSLEFPKDEYDRDRSPLWYLVASAPLVAWSGTLGPETVHSLGVAGPSALYCLWVAARRFTLVRRASPVRQCGRIHRTGALLFLACDDHYNQRGTVRRSGNGCGLGIVRSGVYRHRRCAHLICAARSGAYGTGGEFFCYRFHWFLQWEASFRSSFFCR